MTKQKSQQHPLRCETCNPKCKSYLDDIAKNGLFEIRLMLEAVTTMKGCASHSSAPAPDFPDNDGTDFAHPAYWRGEKHTVQVFIQWMEKLISGKKDKSGRMSNPRLEKIRDWVIDHRNIPNAGNLSENEVK